MYCCLLPTPSTSDGGGRGRGHGGRRQEGDGHEGRRGGQRRSWRMAAADGAGDNGGRGGRWWSRLATTPLSFVASLMAGR
uniref:Uncharacterized protein n=1 Tax=Oryza rufipogon TaxID=4529 RepID=A0A0E0MY04_ORYRU